MGYPHPDVLLEELTSSQFSEWIAYGELEPFGTWTDDYRIARLSALVSNLAQAVWGDRKSRKWADIQDFLPAYLLDGVKEPTKEQSVEEMREIIYRLAGKTPPVQEETDDVD